MDEFVGLKVHVHLVDGHVVDGSIAMVSEEGNVILIADAVVKGGVEVLHFPRLEVGGEQIMRIDLADDVVMEKFLRKKTSIDELSVPVKLDVIRTTSHVDNVNRERKKKDKDWSQEDVRRYKREEFNFEENLKLFDKKKIFNEIRSQDGTRPEDRLVALNLNNNNSSRHQQQMKMSHKQNVLDSRNNNSGVNGDEEDDFVLLMEKTKIQQKQKQPVVMERMRIPLVDPSVCSSIDQQVISQQFMSNEQLIENAGSNLARFLLNNQDEGILGGILIWYTADRLGAIALCAGRHLLACGMQVSAVSGSEETLLAPAFLNSSIRQFQRYGGILQEGSQYSLIISCVVDMMMPLQKNAICSLVRNDDAKWNVRFGLPSNVPVDGTCIVCNVGWPPILVDSILGGTGGSGGVGHFLYSSLFTQQDYITYQAE